MTLTPPLVCFAAIGLGTALAYGLAYRPEFTAGACFAALLLCGVPGWIVLHWAASNWEEEP